MATTAIDTLRYARRLREAGVPSEQAEAMADAIGSELVEQLATKTDIRGVQAEIRELKAWVEGKFQLLYWMLGFNLAFAVAIALARISHRTGLAIRNLLLSLMFYYTLEITPCIGLALCGNRDDSAAPCARMLAPP